MEKQRIEDIAADLDEARHFIDGIMDANDPGRIALDHLCKAMEAMVREWRRELAANAKVANDVSCMQNGILPD